MVAALASRKFPCRISHGQTPSCMRARGHCTTMQHLSFVRPESSQLAGSGAGACACANRNSDVECCLSSSPDGHLGSFAAVSDAQGSGSYLPQVPEAWHQEDGGLASVRTPPSNRLDGGAFRAPGRVQTTGTAKDPNSHMRMCL